jgi:preprotein translocase subunit SecA
MRAKNEQEQFSEAYQRVINEYSVEEHSKSLTLNEEEINVVQEALTRLEPESFSNDEFYNEEEVNRMLYIAQDILKRSGVE